MPYLQRCEAQDPGAYDRLLRDFILTRSHSDLSKVVQIFEASKPSVADPVIRCPTELMSLVLEALYSCERDDQLNIATQIFQCLPARHTDTTADRPDSGRLHKQVGYVS